MKVAYLVNQYPAVSHTFIRREIAALEGKGMAVERFSIRRSEHGLVDEDAFDLDLGLSGFFVGGGITF